jgi:ribosomal protein L40E
MAEILTESFCERCGTRYTFEAKAPRKGRVGRMRVLSKGLRNYVLSDETTLEEALEEARGDEERQLSTQQLEAFHQTFNFCMSCRQYTCANCWNEPEARCLSCAPDLSREVLPTAFPDLPIVPSFGAAALAEPAAAEAPPTAWPSTDVRIELGAGPSLPVEDGAAVADEPDAEAPEEIDEERLAARLATLGAAPSVEAATEPEPEPLDETDVAEIAALLAAARATGVAADVVEAEPVEEPEAESGAEQEPIALEGVAPAETAEPESGEGPPPIGPPSVTGPLTLAARHGWDEAPSQADRAQDRAAATAAGDNGHVPAPAPATPPPLVSAAPPPIAPQPAPTRPFGARPGTAPAWPSPSETPQWPEPPGSGAPVAAGPVARHGTNALWVESTRDVVSRPGSGIAACVSCGLPLSASARFCRRCGNRQN